MSEALRHMIAMRDAARASRAQLAEQAAATRNRLAPGRLRGDARVAAEQRLRLAIKDTKDHIRAHPIETAVSIGAVIAWVLRRPLLRAAPPAAQSAYNWLAGYFSAQTGSDNADDMPLRDDTVDNDA